jgi:hypothetical protein
VGSASQQGRTHEWAVSTDRADPPCSKRIGACAKESTPIGQPHWATGGKEGESARARVVTDRWDPPIRRRGRVRNLAGVGDLFSNAMS